MKPVLVSGLINIETTLAVERFPVEYSPVRYPFSGVGSTVSGVGYNVAKALTTLGHQVHLLSLLGQDLAARTVRQVMAEEGVGDAYVIPQIAQTPQSVILYDPDGRRQVNTDLKNIQEQRYPEELFERVLEECGLAVLCNINFSRPFPTMAKEAGRMVATDVHALSPLEDEYNRDFMAAADILFMSHECLPLPPEMWAAEVVRRYSPTILVIGLGGEGALLAVPGDGFMERVPARRTRPVRSTIGAGDALFSSFLSSYYRTGDPYEAIRKAILFASYKIGEAGAAEGFLTAGELEALYHGSSMDP